MITSEYWCPRCPTRVTVQSERAGIPVRDVVCPACGVWMCALGPLQETGEVPYHAAGTESAHHTVWRDARSRR